MEDAKHGRLPQGLKPKEGRQMKFIADFVQARSDQDIADLMLQEYQVKDC